MTTAPDVPRLDYAPPARRVSRLHRVLWALAILSALTGAAWVSRSIAVRKQEALARLQLAQVTVESLQSALDAFKTDVGRYPTAEEGLAVLINRPAEVDGCRGPYVGPRGKLSDPWGRPYIYTAPAPGSGYSRAITSAGADGKPGTGDDVSPSTRAGRPFH